MAQWDSKPEGGTEVQATMPQANDHSVLSFQGPSITLRRSSTLDIPKTQRTPITRDVLRGGVCNITQGQSPGNLSLNPSGQCSRASSAAGRSDLSFRLIETVRCRGIMGHAAWEHRCSRSESPADRQAAGKSQKPDRICYETTDGLSDEIWNSLERSALNDHSDFLPLDELSKIISPAKATDLLMNNGLEEDEVKWLVSGIFEEWQPRYADDGESTGLEKSHLDRQPTRRRRLFAILVMLCKETAIRSFIENDIDDSALPLVWERKEATIEDPKPRKEVRSGTDVANGSDFKTRFAACFADFRPKELHDFCTYQGIVHVPFLQFPTEDTQIYFYDLDPDCVLPFTAAGESKSGGYGTVKRIVIHPAHHNAGGLSQVPGMGQHRFFALKELHQPDRQKFRNEVEVYERLAHKRKRDSPDHLMHLELAYWHRGRGHLVFPWADGNLKEFWEVSTRCPTNQDDMTWFFKQCYGIALGLRRLHDPESYQKAVHLKCRPDDDKGDEMKDIISDVVYKAQKSEYGRHGDLKPDNILWFRTYDGHVDHLVIADFGSTEFNSHVSRSHVPAAKIDENGYTGTYKPPESQFDGEVSQKYDVWSLGCVFLELIVWFYLGSEDVLGLFPADRVKDNRGGILSEDKFFELDYNKRHEVIGCKGINPSVLERMERIHSLPSCSAAVHDFLDMIRRSMLQVKPSDRETGQMIRRELQEIYKTCCKDKKYATAGYARKSDRPFTRASAPPIIAQERPGDRDNIPFPRGRQPTRPLIFPKFPEEIRTSQLPSDPDGNEDDISLNTEPSSTRNQLCLKLVDDVMNNRRIAPVNHTYEILESASATPHASQDQDELLTDTQITEPDIDPLTSTEERQPHTRPEESPTRRSAVENGFDKVTTEDKHENTHSEGSTRTEARSDAGRTPKGEMHRNAAPQGPIAAELLQDQGQATADFDARSASTQDPSNMGDRTALSSASGRPRQMNTLSTRIWMSRRLQRLRRLFQNSESSEAIDLPVHYDTDVAKTSQERLEMHPSSSAAARNSELWRRAKRLRGQFLVGSFRTLAKFGPSKS